MQKTESPTTPEHSDAAAPQTPEATSEKKDVAATSPTSAAGYRYPATGKFKFLEPITEEGLAEVDRIKEEALAAGWTEAQLYQNRARFRFPSSHEYGLICYIKGARRITRVTKTSVVIENDKGTRFTHYKMNDDSNPAVSIPSPTRKGRLSRVKN